MVKQDFNEFKEVIESDRENKIVFNIEKHKFFDFMNKHDFHSFDLREFIYSKKLSSENIFVFNNLLRQASSELKFKIYECVLFIESDLANVNFILSCLDGDNKMMLKNELGELNNKSDDTEISKYIKY